MRTLHGEGECADMITRHEQSRLSFCKKQDAVLRRRLDKAETALLQRDRALEARVALAKDEYEANAAEMKALEEKSQERAA